MLLVALLLLPLAAAVPALVAPRYHPSIAATSAAASGAAFLAALGLARANLRGGVPSIGPEEFLRADGLSAVLALVVSGVACVSLWFGAGYLERVRDHGGLDDARLRRFYVLTNLFVATMLLAVTANNVGVMWVAVEGTTIATAFLIGLEHSKAALEASWKYILIGSIGIALAFVGTVLGYFDFVQRVGEAPHALHWTVLARASPGLNGDVLRLAFVFILVGYGTKAGLAPMHTWLPDAHSEAPAPISAMMSGSLLVVALYAVARWKVVVDAGVGPGYAGRMLILFGLASLVLAAVLLIRQSSYKRMLAYSSVEHIGLMCLGLGLGPLGTLAALLHMIGHAASKSLAFLASGNLLEAYGSPRIASVRGVLRVLPWTGALFLVAALALLGLPPFGLFVSEVMLVRAGFLAGRPWLMGAVLALLVAIFLSFLGHLHRMLFGIPPADVHPGERRPLGLLPLGFNVAVLLALGLVVPEPLLRLLRLAAGVLRP